MRLADMERKKDEKVNGVIYDMSPAPGYRHGIINGNIYSVIKAGLKNSLCLVFMENLDFHYHPDVNDDYLCPDIMVVCDRQGLKGGSYSGVPRFIVETLSPSTAKRDRTEKKDIYETAGVEEDGKYILEQDYILQEDREDPHYNADMEISLKAFPHIKMRLSEIFEGVDE